MISAVEREVGESTHGSHVEAPWGCPATSTPSVSSSQPMVPHGLRRNVGVPA